MSRAGVTDPAYGVAFPTTDRENKADVEKLRKQKAYKEALDRQKSMKQQLSAALATRPGQPQRQHQQQVGDYRDLLRRRTDIEKQRREARQRRLEAWQLKNYSRMKVNSASPESEARVRGSHGDKRREGGKGLSGAEDRDMADILRERVGQAEQRRREKQKRLEQWQASQHHGQNERKSAVHKGHRHDNSNHVNETFQDKIYRNRQQEREARTAQQRKLEEWQRQQAAAMNAERQRRDERRFGGIDDDEKGMRSPMGGQDMHAIGDGGAEYNSDEEMERIEKIKRQQE